jgi:hypothetical protein
MKARAGANLPPGEPLIPKLFTINPRNKLEQVLFTHVATFTRRIHHLCIIKIEQVQ